MKMTTTELPEALDQVSLAMFELLWGQDRPTVLTAVDQAYEWIWRQLIVTAGKESKRLSDVALSAQLQISRTPIRQALDRLAQEGLIQFDPRRGFWTYVFTAQDVHEIYDIREANEVLALRLAIPHLQEDDLKAQLNTLSTIRVSLPQLDIAFFLKSDLRLHNLLIHASGNGRLIRFLAALRSQLALFQVRDTWYPHRIETALNDHEQILLALLDRNTEQAARLLSEHIAHAKAGVLVDMFYKEEEGKG
jgi:DNA-binding GntR family transcriptional regulator